MKPFFIQDETQKKPGDIEWMCLNPHGYIHSFYAPRQYGPDGHAETRCRICGEEAMPVEEKELMENDIRQVY